MQDIIIYETDNQIKVEITYENNSLWLNLNQISELFDRDKSVISRHIKNIYKEKEVKEYSTVAKNATVQREGNRKVTRKIEYYNLDIIIAIGYRVSSAKGTQFRIWANNILKEHLIQGYTINKKRLAQKEQEIQVLKNGIQILSRSVGKVIEEKVTNNEWLDLFTKGLNLLDDYDHELLDTKGLTKKKANYPTLDEYIKVINQMKSEFDSDIFGKEKDTNFQSSITQITKGFGEDDFYPTLEEKAATLLYLIVKNHSFVDGNKRIAAASFLKFLQENDMLFKTNGKTIIDNDTLASLTLFIASSKPEEMKTVKNLVISVLNRNKQTP